MRIAGILVALLTAFADVSFGQTELIVNGGFENGPNGWTNYGFGQGQTFTAFPALAHSGTSYLKFGPAQPNISIIAAQTVSLPTNTIYAQLSYWDDPYCPNPNGGVFTVSIYNTNLTFLTNLDTVIVSQTGQLGGSNIYTANSFDLTPFAGTNIVVVFKLDTGSSSGSVYVGLDDVSLQLGTTDNLPTNDRFTNRMALTGTNITVTENNFFATVEPQEPFHAGNSGGRSLWWTWTAPADGSLQVDTTGSDFFTLLGVYTGSSLSNLVKVASDNSLNESTSFANIKIAVHAGTTYQIAVDGLNSGSGAAFGTVHLNLHYAPDKTAPKVTITSPAANSQIFNGIATFHGTASDNVAVGGVQYRLENVAGTNSYMPTDGTNQLHWSVTVSNLIPGPNTIRLRAFDTAGNTSAPVARTIDFPVIGTLTLQTNGSGRISSIPRAPFLVGHTYSLTEQPNPGNLFSNWTGDVFSANPKLTFVMQSNMTIEANFVTNVFLAVKGTYAGLFFPSDGITTSNAGYFKATVSSKGALSGRVTLPVISASVSAKINLDGSFSNNISRPGKTPIVFTGQIDLTGGDAMAGQFSADDQVADLTANRSVFSKMNPCPLAGRRYTVVIPPGGGDESPGGFGSGTVALDISGNVTFAGILGDNTRVTPIKSFVSKDGLWPLFATPYGKLGSILGWFTFDLANPGNPPIGDVNWLKATNHAAKFYPNGFSDVISTGNSPYVGSNNAPIFTWTSGQAVLFGGNLETAITNPFTIGSNNKVFGSNGMTLTFTATTGAFKGAVKNAGKSIPISGAAHQNLDGGFGVFAGTNETGGVILIPSP